MMSVSLSIAGILLFLVLQLETCSATANNSKVVSTEKTDGHCHCHTELTLSVPPCVCTGMAEALQEVIRLKNDIRELRDKCSTININVTYYACKYKFYNNNIIMTCIVASLLLMETGP